MDIPLHYLNGLGINAHNLQEELFAIRVIKTNNLQLNSEHLVANNIPKRLQVESGLIKNAALKLMIKGSEIKYNLPLVGEDKQTPCLNGSKQFFRFSFWAKMSPAILKISPGPF